ncbi:MAG: arginine decarboxylase, pyruvoyl-dependent [Desulfuromonadales bacterium]
MFDKTPASHFFTCGSAEGSSRANSLDGARVDAGIGNANLFEAGSVVPPFCSLVEAHELPAGVLAPTVRASITSDVPGEFISAGIAVAYPVEEGQVALVMEYAACGHKEVVETLARRMADEGLRKRGLEVREIRSIAVQHKVERVGAVVAAVVLCNK